MRFTCDGEDRSPLLIWSAPPAGTVELALLVTDDDAGGFVHWAVAGIPPTAGEVGEGAQITGAIEGRNDFGDPGWSGPCPPAGAPHTYRFTLYALSQQAELPEDFTGADLAGRRRAGQHRRRRVRPASTHGPVDARPRAQGHRARAVRTGMPRRPYPLTIRSERSEGERDGPRAYGADG